VELLDTTDKKKEHGVLEGGCDIAPVLGFLFSVSAARLSTHPLACLLSIAFVENDLSASQSFPATHTLLGSPQMAAKQRFVRFSQSSDCQAELVTTNGSY
jgi:hypothetical protein